MLACAELAAGAALGVCCCMAGSLPLIEGCWFDWRGCVTSCSVNAGAVLDAEVSGAEDGGPENPMTPSLEEEGIGADACCCPVKLIVPFLGADSEVDDCIGGVVVFLALFSAL